MCKIIQHLVVVWEHFSLRHFPSDLMRPPPYEALLTTFSIAAVALLHGDFRGAGLPDGSTINSIPPIVPAILRRTFAVEPGKPSHEERSRT